MRQELSPRAFKLGAGRELIAGSENEFAKVSFKTREEVLVLAADVRN